MNICRHTKYMITRGLAHGALLDGIYHESSASKCLIFSLFLRHRADSDRSSLCREPGPNVQNVETDKTDRQTIRHTKMQT